MENNLSLENLNKKILDFLDKVESVVDDDLQSQVQLARDYLSDLENLKKNCFNFYNSLESDDLFLLFKRKKIKLFSSKLIETNMLSESLLGSDLTLKAVFNKKTTEVKSELWLFLHEIYVLIADLTGNMEKEKVKEINGLINKHNFSNFSNEVFNKIPMSFCMIKCSFTRRMIWILFFKYIYNFFKI